ncbi:MAG: MopE-related protein [Polyangiaceae bacterium]
MRTLGTLAGVSLVLSLVAPLISPTYRGYAHDYGAFSDRLGRFGREIVDLDGDGFSAVFGGFDCDDLDESRSPGMLEAKDGRDRNCNGLVRPTNPAPPDLGIAPPTGEPDAAPGTIDRVVVVTFDCFRNDAFRPDVTPNLVRIAAGGLTLTRLQAAGSRTALALPLMLRGSYDAPPVAAALHDAGVSSTVVFAYRHGSLEGNVLDGFENVQRPASGDKRFRATEVTDRALADLADPARARKHFLWVHYFDAHGPRAARMLPADRREAHGRLPRRPRAPLPPPVAGRGDARRLRGVPRRGCARPPGARAVPRHRSPPAVGAVLGLGQPASSSATRM